MASKFQQRHYEAIAQVMRNNCPHPLDEQGRWLVWLSIKSDLEALFQVDNPHFKSQKFHEACHGH